MLPAVTFKGVTKHFGPTLAVNDISFEIRPGRVHALMGENGAGKSTLMKILAGVHQPDAGKIAIAGRQVCFANPSQALAAGVSTVFQELSLLPNLSITENMFLGKEIMGRFGSPHRAEMAQRTKEALSELGMSLDPNTLVSELSIAQRQFVEIAHGIKADAQVFILDEPTAALNAADVQVLNARIEKLKAKGKAIVYISHRMDEIFAICDDVTIMKDGAHVATQSLSDLTPERLITLMVGRELNDLFPDRARDLGPVRLSCQDLRLTPEASPLSFDLHSGEILGLAGLEGQGQSEIVRSMIGQYAANSGKVRIGSQTVLLPVTASAGVRNMQQLSLGFVPEDRKEEGLLLGAAIRENIGIGLQSARPGFKPLAKVADVTRRIMADLNIKAGSSTTPVGTLSGGNQQKVLLGRYLASDMDILIIEEPTRGVDIGAKVEIYRLLRELAQRGMAILVLSRETVELIGLCDRLLVVHDRKIVSELAGAEASEHNILNAALTS
ncbi:sugar ABC transporter ATP-binding protein [uncultured Tateyamaria sp.]|uniref:sugar ABC transporter ATP-binding protein n=1 Tax=Tateyamaria sp. 1078 TaxID=3417464 RepID=UPI00260742BF|nr:sugar ABC transporter ATP-binding protein [uncultured Tateyamaria sp.]